MRFKQFLEAQVKPYDHEPKVGDDLINALRDNCSKALYAARAGDFIFRGTRSDLAAGVYNPGSGERVSQNTSNFYTNFLDTNEANSAFPKRGNSFIASTRKTKAYGYVHSSTKTGTLMYCFPFDDTDIGIVNDDDMWDLRLHFGKPFSDGFNIVDLNDFWIDILDDNYGDLKDAKSLDDIRRFLRKCPPGKIVNLLAKEHLLADGSSKLNDTQVVDKFIDALPTAYSYKELGCTVGKADDITSDKGEVWFSGKCVMVPANDMLDLYQEFGL